MTLDAAKAWSNAIVGLVVSAVAVTVLRAAGLWVTLSPLVISAVFFGLSLARSRALLAMFRRMEK